MEGHENRAGIDGVSIHSCNKDVSMFCFVCGKFDTSKNRKKFSLYEEKYKSYFNLQIITGIEKAWVPSSISNPCRTMLYRQASNTKTKYLIETSVIWNEPRTNEECYLRKLKIYSNSFEYNLMIQCNLMVEIFRSNIPKFQRFYISF